MIVTVGFNLAGGDRPGGRTPTRTRRFIGVDQSPICVTADGLQDFTFACPGDAKTLLPNYTSLDVPGGPGRLPRRDRGRRAEQVR